MADALVAKRGVTDPTRAEILRAAETLSLVVPSENGDQEYAGLSSLDRPTVKSILAFGTPTDRQIRCLWMILGKYGSPLARAGVDYAALVPPPLPAGPGDGRAPLEVGSASAATPAQQPKPGKTVSFHLGATKEWVAVVFSFRPKLVAAAQKLANRRFDKEGTLGGVPKSWVIPTDPISIEAAMAAFQAVGPEVVLDPSPEIRQILAQSKVSYVESRAETADIVVPVKRELYPFQRAGVKGIDDRKGRALLADEMGLGKTWQALGWMAFRKEIALPALVVCKAMLKVNWVLEAALVTDFKCLILAGQNSVGQLRKLGFNVAETPQPGYDITIVNYDLFSIETPKTWLKMLLNDDKEEALKEKLVKLGKDGPEKEIETLKERIAALGKERKYAADQLFSAGRQGLDLLERAMEKHEGLASRNRIWSVVEAIQGDPDALGEKDPEYARHFVNGQPLDDFMKSGWKTLVCDESHYVKETDAQRTGVTMKMSKSIPHVLCMTGTPILNRPKDLWSQTQIVNPMLFPSFFAYGKEFCGAFQKPIGSVRCTVCNGTGKRMDDVGVKAREKDPNYKCDGCKGEGRIIKMAWVFSGVSNLDKLEKTLRSTIMIRRMKDQVMKELPKKTRKMMPFVIEEKNERTYKKGTLTPMERLAKLKKERDEWKAVLATMTDEDRRKFIAEHAEQAARNNRLTGMMLDDIEKIKQAAVDARFAESLAFILDVHEQEGKILVFASHHATIDRLLGALTSEGIKAAVIDGRVPAAKREEIKKSFQEGDLEVLICGIRAAAEGLTLTAAHIVVMFELDWHPGIHAQAEDRVHRIGQTMSVFIYYLIAMGTIEEKIAKMVDAKREVMNTTLGEGDRTLSEDGILDAVVEAILGKAA